MKWAAISVGTVTAMAVALVAIWVLSILALPLIGAFIWMSWGQNSVAHRAPSPRN